MELPELTALTTSWGVRLYERSLSGSTLTVMARMDEPNGAVATVPGTNVCNKGRTRYWTRSPISPSECALLLNTK